MQLESQVAHPLRAFLCFFVVLAHDRSWRFSVDHKHRAVSADSSYWSLNERARIFVDTNRPDEPKCGTSSPVLRQERPARRVQLFDGRRKRQWMPLSARQNDGVFRQMDLLVQRSCDKKNNFVYFVTRASCKATRHKIIAHAILGARPFQLPPVLAVSLLLPLSFYGCRFPLFPCDSLHCLLLRTAFCVYIRRVVFSYTIFSITKHLNILYFACYLPLYNYNLGFLSSRANKTLNCLSSHISRSIPWRTFRLSTFHSPRHRFAIPGVLCGTVRPSIRTTCLLSQLILLWTLSTHSSSTCRWISVEFGWVGPSVLLHYHYHTFYDVATVYLLVRYHTQKRCTCMSRTHFRERGLC